MEKSKRKWFVESKWIDGFNQTYEVIPSKTRLESESVFLNNLNNVISWVIKNEDGEVLAAKG